MTKQWEQIVAINFLKKKKKFKQPSHLYIQAYVYQTVYLFSSNIYIYFFLKNIFFIIKFLAQQGNAAKCSTINIEIGINSKHPEQQAGNTDYVSTKRMGCGLKSNSKQLPGLSDHLNSHRSKTSPFSCIVSTYKSSWGSNIEYWEVQCQLKKILEETGTTTVRWYFYFRV